MMNLSQSQLFSRKQASLEVIPWDHHLLLLLLLLLCG
jgi:hypothetical protein